MPDPASWTIGIPNWKEPFHFFVDVAGDSTKPKAHPDDGKSNCFIAIGLYISPRGATSQGTAMNTGAICHRSGTYRAVGECKHFVERHVTKDFIFPTCPTCHHPTNWLLLHPDEPATSDKSGDTIRSTQRLGM
jgi:hypothetical protein